MKNYGTDSSGVRHSVSKVAIGQRRGGERINSLSQDVRARKEGAEVWEIGEKQRSVISTSKLSQGSA